MRLDKTIQREKINFDYETIRELWNGVYFKGEIYKQIEKINTSEYSDGESWDYIIQRNSDGKYFTFHVWDAGEHNGYIFSDETNSLTEVFPKTITKIIYE